MIRQFLPLALAATLAVHTAPAAAQRPAPMATQPTTDYSIAIPVPGRWTYAPTQTGTSATFYNGSNQALLTFACTKSSRRVSISRPSATPSPTMALWGNGTSSTLPARFDAAAGRVSVSLGAYDQMLDALAFSRGRMVVTPAGSTPLVAPVWPDIIRVIEDCRV